MNLRTFLLYIFLCIGLFPLVAQTEEAAYLQNQLLRANRYSLYNPQEKVYLHFDNTGYFQGETMHFKAYVIRTDTEKLSALSHVLYVDLITPNGDVVAKRKLLLNNGLARGDFKLDELLLSGFYEVRAYTRYMVNWGVDACFSRVLPIFKEPKEAGDYSQMTIDQFSYRQRLMNRRSDELRGDTINAELERRNHRGDISVHFYPEGGNLVEGLESRVAYAVLDDGAEVLRGSMMVTPGQDQTLKARYDKKTNQLTVDPNGKFKLPKALKQGLCLTLYVQGETAIMAQVKASEELRHEMVGYALMHNGVIRRSDTLRVEQGLQLSFERNELDEGVNQLTFFNKEGHILAERLFFIYPKPSPEDSVRITTTTQLLEPLKKVSFDIQARPYSSLSFTAIDAAKTTGGKQGNIRANLLLSSDLRGYVANPEYYLEADDAEHRQATDLLMMVQGWRRYDWQEMVGIKPLTDRQPIEDRLAVYGRIVPQKRKLVTEGIEISATMYNREGQCMEGDFVTGVDGSYVFDLPDITGEWALNLRTKREGELQNFNILIDRNFAPECRYISPEESQQLPIGTPNFAWGEKQSVSYNISDREHLHRYLLPEVEVKKRSSRFRGWTDEGYAHSAAIVRYDCEAEAERIADEGKGIPSFSDWLLSLGDAFFGVINIAPYRDPNDNVTPYAEGLRPGINSEGPSYHRRPIIWIINNQYWGITSLLGNRGETIYNDNNSEGMGEGMDFPLMLSDAKSLYISEDLEAVRKHFFNPTVEARKPVVFYCFTRNFNPKSRKKGERFTHFQGFDVPTYFEMNYSDFQPLQDIRRTLHWTSFTTDAEGKAHIEFFNNLNCTEMIISVEGISVDGHLQAN